MCVYKLWMVTQRREGGEKGQWNFTLILQVNQVGALPFQATEFNSPPINFGPQSQVKGAHKTF